jgi:hypothetical protein
MPSRKETLAGWVSELAVEQEEINDLLKHVIRHRARIREKLQLLEQLQQLEEDSAKNRPPAPPQRVSGLATTPDRAPQRSAPDAPQGKSGKGNGRSLAEILGEDTLDSEIEAAARELFEQS